jgi:saccharopine dehydrogenase-like NADP-dependent oxidoreductase
MKYDNRKEDGDPVKNSVFILGGGRMGLVAARDLAESAKVEEVIIGDVKPANAQSLARDIGSDKIQVTKVDGKDPSKLKTAIQGSQVLVNAIWYEYNLHVMQACIAAHVHYTDLGGLFHMTRKQLKLNREAKKAEITAVLGGGESPGITNILCSLLAQRVDSIKEIKIRVGGRATSTTPTNKIAFPFAVSTIFDEYSKAPVVYRNRRFQEVAPLSGEEEVEFPEPVGRNRCHYTLHSEIATLPLSFKEVENVDFKLGISEEIFKAVKPLLDAGLTDEKPLDVKGHKISSRDFSIALLGSRASKEEPTRYVSIRIEVRGLKKGKPRKQVCELVQGPSERIGVRNATAFLTGTAASIIAQFLLNGKIEERGVFPPEICVSPSQFTGELERRGIRVLTKSQA